VKQWLTQGVFPPKEKQISKNGLPPFEQMSLWREQYIALVLIVAMLLETMNRHGLHDHLHRLSSVCKNSKRKRRLQLHFFSSA